MHGFRTQGEFGVKKKGRPQCLKGQKEEMKLESEVEAKSHGAEVRLGIHRLSAESWPILASSFDTY